MSAVVIVALVVIGLFLLAAGYVWGWLNGSESDPEDCRAKLRAAEQSAQMWRTRAVQLEGEKKEHEQADLATVGWLLKQLDLATAATAQPEALALTAGTGH